MKKIGILLILSVALLLSGFTVKGNYTLHDVEIVRRYAVDPNGVMTLVYEASTEPNDVSSSMPPDYQIARSAALQLDENLRKILILDLQQTCE